MKCSVAMCTYNGAKFIEKQLNSILMQSRAVDEIIISDDGSTDDTLKIAETMLSNSNISYEIKRNITSLGVVKNFQQAYEMCQGDIIFSCDQDDIWREDKVEVIMRYFEENTHIDLIATNARLIDQDDQVMSKDLKEMVGFRCPSRQDEWVFQLLRKCCITGATMAFRKTLFNQFFKESRYWLHDAWLSMMAAMKNSLYYLDDRLIDYRLHGNNSCGLGEFKPFKTALTKPFYFQDLFYEKYQSYLEFYDFIECHKELNQNKFQNKLKECIEFWKIRLCYNKMSFFECVKKTKMFASNHYYELYTNSNYYKWYDRYFWLIYHIFSSKCHKFSDIHDK